MEAGTFIFRAIQNQRQVRYNVRFGELLLCNSTSDCLETDSRVSSARGMTDEDSKEDPTVLAPTLDEFRPEKMTKYVIWASVITTLFEVPGRVRPGGRSDRKSRFYAPSRFRRTCDLGFERFGKNTHGPPKQRGDDRDRPCPALEGMRLGVPGKFAPL